MQWSSVPTQNIDTHVSNTYYPGLTHQGEGIDLRIEMHNLLYGNVTVSPKGHWVVLRRFNYNIKSQFYNEATKEGVGGPAYSYTDELLRARRNTLSKSFGPDELKIGGTLVDKFIYYFEYTVKPIVSYEIFELDWDNHLLKPTLGSVNYIERYKIEKVLPYRLENGNIQYYSVMAQQDEITYG